MKKNNNFVKQRSVSIALIPHIYIIAFLFGLIVQTILNSINPNDVFTFVIGILLSVFMYLLGLFIVKNYIIQKPVLTKDVKEEIIRREDKE